MKRSILFVLCLLLFVGLAFAQGGYNSYRTLSTSSVKADIGILQNRTILYHQMSWSGTATGATCSIDSSPDNSSWTVGGIVPAVPCNGVGIAPLASAISANYVRINVSGIGAGTVNVVYTGWSLSTMGNGQSIFPSALNGSYYVDGITYPTANAIWAANPNGPTGPVIYPNPTGNVTFTTDPFLNTATPNAPTVVLLPNASCTGVAADARVATGNVVTVRMVSYDTNGRSAWAPLVTSAVGDGTGTQCYQVTPGALILGVFNARIFASTCAAPGPCSGPFTLQISGAGSTLVSTLTARAMNLTAANYGSCATTGGTVGTPWQCGAQPVASNTGLQVFGASLKLQGGTYSSTVPIAISPGARFSGMGAANIATGTLYGTTVLKLDAGAPNGIPCPIEPYGVLVSGGAGLGDRQLSVQHAYIEQTTLGTPKVMCVSQPITMPAFPSSCAGSGNCQVSVINPSPPLLQGGWMPSMRVWKSLSAGVTGGTRITDCQWSNTANPVCLNPTSVWVATTDGVTGTSYPFSAGACGTQGASTVTDGGVTWLCLLKGAPWVVNAATAYAAGQEVWDNVNKTYQEQIVGAGCTSANAPSQPATFRANFAGVSAVDGTCFWMNVGQTTVVGGAFEAFVNICTVASGKYCVATGAALKLVTTCPTTNATRCATGVNYDFNGFTSFTGAGGQSTTATQPTGTTATSSLYGAAGGGASPPSATLTNNACPTGFGGQTWTAQTAQYMWATPMGLTPPFGESSAVTPTNGTGCGLIAAPSDPPPNAIGWVPAVANGSNNLQENVYAPDGVNMICGDGAIDKYVPNLGSGVICRLGVTAFESQKYTGTRTMTPWLNTSDNFISMGNSPLMQLAPIDSRFWCRIEDMFIDLGRVVTNLEPFGGAIFNNQCQEESLPKSVTVADAAQYAYYVLGTSAQNSDLQDFRVQGQNMDYTQNVRMENLSSWRGAQGGTLSAPVAGTQYLSRNCLHVLGTPWQAVVGTRAHDISCEAVLDGFLIENGSLKVEAVGTTSSANRIPLNVMHFGPYSSSSIAEAVTGATTTCFLQDDTTPNFTTGCPTLGQRTVGRYDQKNNVEILAADTGNLTAATIVFSWSRGQLDQGKYGFTCSGFFTNSAGGTSGLTVSVQTALAAAPITAWGWSFPTVTTVSSAAIVQTNVLTVTPVYTSGSVVAPAMNPFFVKGDFTIGANGTQFNVLFGNVVGGNTVIKADSECEIHGK